MQYEIRVRADTPLNTVQVAGKIFSKFDGSLLHENEMTDEIRNSSLLDVKEIHSEPIAEKIPSTDSLDPSEPIVIQTNDGINEGEARDAGKVLSQRKDEKKRK